MKDEDIKLLEKYGWFVECQLPFEIRNECSGEFITGPSTYAMIWKLRRTEQQN